jgi:hypothetical protein
VHETVAFDALGYTFRVKAQDRPLIALINDLFLPMAKSVRPEHEYAFRVLPDGDHRSQQLTLDEEPLGGTFTPARLLPMLVHQVNQNAIGGCDFLVLHAGGVEQDGAGLVFPGEMEAGKTTLVAGLVRAGFGYLTDEAVALDRQTLEIHPYPKPLSIDRGAWHLFPELEPHADLTTGEDETEQWQVPAQAIRTNALGNPCAVAVIVFPRYSKGAHTALEPMHRSEALVELTRHTFKFNEQAREALDLLADVVRGAESYRLTTGALESAVDAVRGLVGVSPSADAESNS